MTGPPKITIDAARRCNAMSAALSSAMRDNVMTMPFKITQNVVVFKSRKMPPQVSSKVVKAARR